MNKRKILTLALSLCMIAILAIGGTLAYFTETEKVTNEMTVGNIQINLEEVKLENGAWVDYNEEEPLNLFPVKWEDRAAHGMQNNKAARVYNVSSSGKNAYLRTIVAIPTVLDDVIGLGFAQGEAWNAESNGVKRYGCEWEKVGTVNFDGYDHDIYVCDTVGGVAVEKGNYMLSLTSVWMYDTVTNEKLDALVKAENNGVTLDETTGMIDFDVKVLSQGVQTEGFAGYDEAMASFGPVLANVGSWFAGEDTAVINDYVNK